jgi:hypothetical protein
MKWYTCCNENGLKHYGECLLAACRSCLANTSLLPVLIYDGPKNPFTEYLAVIGVSVVYHELSFQNLLAAQSGSNNHDPKWASAVFLRFDIPLVEQEDDYVLYADADVVFCSEFDFRGNSAALYAANEIILKPAPPTETSLVFNAGVMVMNLRFFRQIHNILVSHCLDLASGALNVPWYDQGILNHLLRDARQPLGPEYNSRPYLQLAANPVILHFQFLRPAEIAESLASDAENEHLHLYRGNEIAYRRSIDIYETHLDREGIGALRQACPDALTSI